MKTTIFLAGPSAEATRVQRWARTIERTELFDLTADWYNDCSWSGRDAYLTREQQHDIACMHMAAIARSEIVWLLAPRSLAGGSMVELGMAVAFAAHTPGRKVAVSGPGCSRTLYTALATYREEVDELAFGFICRVARELRGEAAHV